MNPQLTEWAVRNGVSFQALAELSNIFGMTSPAPASPPSILTSETHVQSIVRLEAAKRHVFLWRNNVGVLPDERGVPVRYGLANDSPAINKVLKSSDLIGWRPVLISPAHVGTWIAQFLSRECKRPGWTFTGTDRELAQLKWIQAVNAGGGDACFVTGEGTL